MLLGARHDNLYNCRNSELGRNPIYHRINVVSSGAPGFRIAKNDNKSCYVWGQDVMVFGSSAGDGR